MTSERAKRKKKRIKSGRNAEGMLKKQRMKTVHPNEVTEGRRDRWKEPKNGSENGDGGRK